MRIPTIDRQDAVEWFRQLLESETPHRVLLLWGKAGMGKTHLLTKVFPMLAEQHTVRWVVLDLRNPQQDILTYLRNARSKIGHDYFSNFDKAYADRIKLPQIQMKNILMILTFIYVRSPSRDTDAHQILHLTECFVDDLRRLKDRMVVLIFDQVDDAAPATQRWLMHTLLVQVQELAHVRVVVGSRTMPDISHSYATRYKSRELKPVQEERAYIDYCQEVGVGTDFGEESIRNFAKYSSYTPGLFANIVRTVFVPWERPNG